MREKKNSLLREELRKQQIHLYELSDELGVSESALYRWMRHEMSPDQILAVKRASERILAGRG